MMRRLAVLVTALAVAAGWFVVTAPAGSAASGLETAWWWSAESSNGAVPAPPTVPDGGLWVSSNASGPQSVSAVRVTLSPGEAAPTLVLDVHQSLPPTVAELAAFPTTAAWPPGPAQAWSSKPAYDANGVHATGTMSGDGKHVTFDLSGLVTGDALSVVIAPAAAAAAPPQPVPSPPPAPPTFDVTFEKPAPDALRVAPAPPALPEEIAPAPASLSAPAAAEDVTAAPTESFTPAVPTGLSAPLPAVATGGRTGRAAAPPARFTNGRPFVPASSKRAARDTAAIAVMLGLVLLWLARDTGAIGSGRRRLTLYDAPKPAEAFAVARAGNPPPLR